MRLIHKWNAVFLFKAIKFTVSDILNLPPVSEEGSFSPKQGRGQEVSRSSLNIWACWLMTGQPVNLRWMLCAKKAHHRKHFHRKLCAFNVDNTWVMFYSCIIELIFTFSFICWYGSVSLKLNPEWYDHTAEGVEQGSIYLVWAEFPPSSHRDSLPCSTNRLRNSVIPTATGLLDNTRWI